MDETVRQRAKKKLIRVTFPDERELCYKSTTLTFVEALQTIDVNRLQEIKLENCHLPLISQEKYSKFKDDMKLIRDGWYVNTQSDSHQKYMQL